MRFHFSQLGGCIPRIMKLLVFHYPIAQKEQRTGLSGQLRHLYIESAAYAVPASTASFEHMATERMIMPILSCASLFTDLEVKQRR